MDYQKNLKTNVSGFSLVETIITILIFSALFVVILSTFQNSIKQLNASRAKIVAVDLAMEQMEIIRNLSYADVGTVSGSPAGTIADSRTVNRSNIAYTVETRIQYIDDPFDGCVGETDPPDADKSLCADGTIVDKPRDIPANSGNPADYKKAEVSVTWQSFFAGLPVKLSTIIAPKHLEGDTTKGFLLVKVFDSSGTAVLGASVQVTNATLTPAYDKTFLTDSFGNILLLDMEPSLDSYVIKVTKAGYSEDRTCIKIDGGTGCSDAIGNPDPLLKNISIAAGQLEEASFAIDKVSALTVNSYDESCQARPNINFTLMGNKKVSKPPSNIIKNSFAFQTDAAGAWNKADLESDIYDLLVNTAGYDIAGVNHELALSILPDTSTVLNVLLANQTANSLLLTVRDAGGVSLSGASVHLTKTGYDETKITGHGFLQQSDWAGGSGQTDFTDATKYFSDDNHVDHNTSGLITLQKNSLPLSFSESFISIDYKDAVNNTADWNTADEELKLPTFAGKYPASASGQSLKINSQHGNIVSATLTASEDLNGQTANYYLSSDGGLHYENVSLGSLHNFVAVGHDLRFRVELATNDDNQTPVIEDLTIAYNLEYFDGAGELISSTFNLGTAPTFSTITWAPTNQPVKAGSESVKFQIASNNDNATWDFTGPDGTSGTFYTGSNTAIHAGHNGHRYLRYKAILKTDDPAYTPQLNNIRLGYTLACLAPGQTFFSNLEADTYTIDISLAGYQSVNTTIDVSGYTTEKITLTP